MVVMYSCESVLTISGVRKFVVLTKHNTHCLNSWKSSIFAPFNFIQNILQAYHLWKMEDDLKSVVSVDSTMFDC